MCIRAQTEGSPSRVKSATDHHAQDFFLLSVMAVAAEQNRTQKSPSSALDPGDRRNHIISAVIQSHRQGVKRAHSSSGVMLETHNTPDASSQPLARTKLQF